MAVDARKPNVKAAGLIAKRTISLTPEVVRRVADALAARGIEVVADRESARHLGRPAEGLLPHDMVGSVDLVVSLGGDGTFLSVARLFAEVRTPLLGVNLGHLGFLTEVEPNEIERYLDGWLSGRFVVDERMMLDALLLDDERPHQPVAVLNDVVIGKAALARMIEFTVSVDGLVVSSYRADGLIVSTPTGSTAYSLAAGGSLLLPNMDAIIVNPICPHASSQRPLVIPGSSEVKVVIAPGHEDAYVSLDGQVGFPVPEESELVIRRSRLVARIVHDPQRTFFHLLRAKLGWGGVSRA